MRQVKLVECANILYGYPFDSSLFTEDDSYVPLIRIRDVMPGVASTYYTGEILSDYLIKAEDILVGMDGNFNLAKWKDRDGLLNQRTLKISAKDDLCINGYLYHLLGPIFKKIELNTAGGSVKHLSAKTINSIEIPLPPLPIQQEIVRILNSFTSMITNLETELASRQKQYEYYRNKQLTFDENDECVEWKTLGEVSLYSMERINATELDESNYVSVENLLQNKSGKVNSTCCPNEGNWVKYSCGDTLIGNIRPNLRKIWLADIEGGTNGDVLVIHLKDGFRSAIISKYLYYILSSEDFFLYDIQNAKGAKMPRGDKNAVMKFPIAYPSPQRQQEIVSTLDTFESLITNIKQELEARKKQYEYYREQLLTFE